MTEPALVSAVFKNLPVPDWADVVLVSVPATAADPGPAGWARAVFDVRRCPGWVRMLFGVRQALVGLIGIERADRSAFEVSAVHGDEALILTQDRHLDFGAAVAFDPAARLLRVVTAVRLKGWRGRLYFAPVAVLHGPVTRAMARNAVRNLDSSRDPRSRGRR
jgi:hypothetical protein